MHLLQNQQVKQTQINTNLELKISLHYNRCLFVNLTMALIDNVWTDSMECYFTMLWCSRLQFSLGRQATGSKETLVIQCIIQAQNRTDTKLIKKNS